MKLQRHQVIGSSDALESTRVGARITWQDEEADGLNVEVVPRGGTVWADDVGIRTSGAR